MRAHGDSAFTLWDFGLVQVCVAVINPTDGPILQHESSGFLNSVRGRGSAELDALPGKTVSKIECACHPK